MNSPDPLPPHPLTARPISLNSSEFRAIQGWSFPDEPFFVRQVQKMLLHDIPHLVLYDHCTIFGYSDPQVGHDIVGFGTFNLSVLYSRYTNNLPHFYIPLLSINPRIKSLGYGQSIVEHLVAEAAVAVSKLGAENISDRVFLDVYTANDKACKLYREKCQFVTLNPDSPISDPSENNEPYVVMARNIAISI